ncbi:MAG: hypothetical protein JXQ69_05305 [Paludibacteraceae bacterium]|nr:hypothetical protein [Paludibacteraceae bacterium]MBN2787728.1 hypothetical protein [Paludibacteraceae bacterium]
MEIVEMFTTYGSFTILILLGIGYFIKRVFDNKSKQIEIKSSVYHQNRINVINNFFEIYTKAKVTFELITIPEIKNFSCEMLDDLLSSHIDNLNKSTYYRYLYSKNELKYFKQIIKNTKDVHDFMKKIKDQCLDNSLTIKHSEMESFRKSRFEKNEELIIALNEEIRKSYL